MGKLRFSKITQTLVGLFLLWTCSSFASVFYDAQRKLTLKIQNNNWELFSKEDYITQDRLFMAQSKDTLLKSTLTLRIDETDIGTAKKYADKWLKEYPKFGFELQNSGPAKYGSLEGFEFELNNKETGKKVKQFITKSSQEAWVFTCSGNTTQFLKTWEDCKKILSSARLGK